MNIDVNESVHHFGRDDSIDEVRTSRQVFVRLTHRPAGDSAKPAISSPVPQEGLHVP
jgi:hypothetical protein